MKGIHVVGLTGQTGAGKSTVSSLFRTRGIKVIDCDQVSRDVVSGEKSCLADLALEFSIAILNMDGTLNRKKLASIVFGNPQKLSKLNELIFPISGRKSTAGWKSWPSKASRWWCSTPRPSLRAVRMPTVS